MWKVASTLLLTLVLALLAPRSTQGQGDPALQTQTDAAYSFGQVIVFGLRAQSEEPVEAVTLFFNTPQLENTYVVDLEIEPQRELELTHEVLLTQVHLAPFTTITYWWQVEAGGETYQVPQEQLDYFDDRFQWRQLRGEEATVYWTGPDAQLGQVALDTVARARPRLEAVIPTGDVDPYQIYVYPSTADLRSALRLTGRDWVGAHAEPELGVMLVTAVNPRTAAFDLGRSIPHEMVHQLLFEATGAGYDNVARWFDEGLATLFEMAPDPNYPLLVDEAILAGETIPFAELCETFPGEEAHVRLAYAQSVSLVRYLQAEYGNQVLSEMIRAFADGADCHSAVERVLDLSLEELNARWLEREQPLSPLARFWQQNSAWLLLLAGGFGMMTLLILPLRREQRDE
ncbi:MAG: peptidase MA family metallohydrolase [Candidatus Promineifilaceae bacterium]|nr:peptidase MA family metallohydrolase [Candidatus Promineifilaceae bacterium]